MGKRAAKRKTSISPSLSGEEPPARAQPGFAPANYEPHRILDLQQSPSDPASFSFVIVFRRVGDPERRRNLRLASLDFLSERYRQWLLVFFKKNLKDLAVIRKMKAWALARLQLLKEYCEQQGVPFDGLFFKSSTPPRQVYAAQPGRAPRRLPRGSPAKPPARRIAKGASRGGRSCCRSADVSFTDEAQRRLGVARSQASSLRSLQQRIQQCIAKYEGLRNQSVSCEDLFKDINELRNFL